MSTKRRTRKNNAKARRARHRTSARRRISHDAEVLPLHADDLPELPSCECTHGGGGCPESAEFLVTCVCGVDGCAGAASASFACPCCMASWARNAELEGRQLRITLL